MATNEKAGNEQKAGGAASPPEQNPSGGKKSSAAKKPSEKPGAANKRSVSLPSVTLPKGGGAIRGIGEKFDVNPATGTGSLSVPVVSTPGRTGFGPNLSLSYDSGAGNGPFGFGWSMSLPSVSRKTDKGLPRYEDDGESDVFIISGAEDLVPILDGSGNRVRFQRTLHGTVYQISIYRPRTEGLFARIERWKNISTGTSHWRTITRDNVTTLYGLDADSRIADPDDPRKIFSYMISRSFDDKGNVILYQYVADDNTGVSTAQAHELNRTTPVRATQRYIKRIMYGNQQPWFPTWSTSGSEPALPADWHFEVVFDYYDHNLTAPTRSADLAWPVRPDPFSSYRSGFEVRTYRRCRRVLMFHHFPSEAAIDNNCLVRSTDFTYSDELRPSDPANPVYTFLEAVRQLGYRRDGGGGYIAQVTPPAEFEYSKPVIQQEVLTLDPPDFGNLPEGIDGSHYQWVDLDGEGLSGILTDADGGWGYRRNLSPLNRVTLPGGGVTTRARFGAMENVLRLPSHSDLGGGARLMDLASDGQLDLVLLDGSTPGFFERTNDEDWVPFKTFASLPQINWSDPNLRFLDVTGDGLGDALITEEGVFTFYPSLGEEGFGEAARVATSWDEERGPRAVFADGTETIFLADMSGDGLTDIVRVRNGEVCYWPNLGYGRFGARVSMDHAPRFTSDERFDPKRVRLTDIDGSGSTDLLYIAEDGVHVCFNRSGNAWAQPQRIAVFPTADLLSSVQVFDLLGNGTACLVWSSPLPAHGARPLLYVDLMGGVKPHLMIRSRNNIGAETRIRYAPSTKFYLADKMAGRPWITRLPNLVHVVERTEIYDFIGRSRFVTRYAYHHGYFDGIDREFRGFGMVEQWDTEEHRDDTDFPEAEATNWDSTSWVPPVHTKTWFHTGAFVEAGAVTRQYASEYWAEPATRGDTPALAAAREALLLADTVLPSGLTPEEQREAYRALKGSTLRIEVYAEDGTARAEHPYTVTEQNFTIKRIQGIGPNKHAVFLLGAREALHYHYERQPADPRMTHDISLETDDFGNVLRSVTVAYPRRSGYGTPEPDLSAMFQAMLAHDQTRLHVGGTQHIFTSSVNQPWSASSFDAYRGPMPAETLTAELTGISPAAARFTFSEIDTHWATLWTGSYDIPYEQVSTPDIEGVGTPTGLARRIVERTKTRYRSDDLTTLLPFGSLESHALAGESYNLAFTSGLLTRVFGTRVNATILGEGGYVQLPGGAEWWIPSGRVYYSAGDTDTPTVELAEARAHFYMLRRAVDPLGAISRVSYDSYDLLTYRGTDALGNVTTASNDYRVLQAYKSVDPNGNTNEVAFDALGGVVGAAVYGKAGEGDSMISFNPDLTEPEIIDLRNDPLADPASLLGSATSRFVVDRLAYYRTRHLPEPSPAMVYTLTRETHVSDLAPGGTPEFDHLFEYFDGFGREAQQKAQAESGPVVDGGPTVSPRWTGSGWVIYNNKGNAIRRYEPFFSATHEFEFDQQVGVSSIFFYDAVDRVVATLHPDDTFEKTIYGAWRQESWDENDTVLIDDPRTDADVGDFFERLLGTTPGAFTSWHDRRIGGTYGSTSNERAANQNAAQKTELHADTPAVAHFDSLGRTCLSVVDNGTVAGVPQRYATRTAMDTENKPLAIFDARGRHVVEFCLREPLAGGGGFAYVAGYDVAGNAIYHNSMDGGERWSLENVMDETIRTWDARGFTFRMLYDKLERPTHRYVNVPGSGETLVERMVYGETHADASRNLKGRLFRHYDTGGMASFEKYDFKGNLLESVRQLARHNPSTTSPAALDRAPDWSPIATITDTPTLDVSGMDTNAASRLESGDLFTAYSRFDALDRPIQMVTPHRAGGRPSVIQPIYNEANLLESLDVWVRRASAPSALLAPLSADIHAVMDVSYNARGQRTQVILGNGTISDYTYDPDTLHVTSVVTTRPHPNPSARTVQALYYTYDPSGNITRLRDEADTSNVVYFRNRRVDPTADYTYDPLYRLTRATGREHLGLTGATLNAAQQTTNNDTFRMRIPSPGDGNAVDTYAERYTYDEVGNLMTMVHQVASGGWTRNYSYNEQSRITSTERSNRLSATSMPGDPVGGPYSATYRYDAHGSMTRMPHLPEMTWDVDDRLQSTTRQVVGAGVPETTYYSYDDEGNRLRKRTYRQAGAGVTPTRKSERIYLGPFEIYREYNAAGTTVTLERETLNVMLDSKRVLMVETRTIDLLGTDPAPAQMIRYQYGNHLGSVSLELDQNADLLSYEEYFPFGSTAYQATRNTTDTPKRYRYTAKERDEENDLYYHGARYYAPWLGRWTSCDPAGLIDGPNVYAYVSNNPVAASDPTGMWEWRDVAVVAAVVVVGAVVTVATAGAAAPLVAGAVASVGLSGAAATVATGVAVGAVAGAAGGAAGELTRQVARGEKISGKAIGKAALTGAAIGVVTGGVGAAASTARGAAALSKASTAVKSTAVGKAAVTATKTVAAGAKTVAKAPGVKQVVGATKTVANAGAKTMQGVSQAGTKVGAKVAQATFKEGSKGATAAANTAKAALNTAPKTSSTNPAKAPATSAAGAKTPASPKPTTALKPVPNSNNASQKLLPAAPEQKLISAPYYPPNNGFAGETNRKFLMPGELVDRYGGSGYSRFFSPVGTPASARALPAESLGQPLRTFEVMKPFEVEAGSAAPWFGQPGGGTQYVTPVKLEVLLKKGILKEVTR